MNRTLAVAAASTLFTLSTPVLANNLSGFFVGADATIAESYNFDATFLNAVRENDVGDVEGIGISDSFGSFDVKAGYNFDLGSKLFVGLEANYNLSGIDEAFFESTSRSTNSIAKEDSYGIRAKIGRLVSDDTAFYGILGYQITDFELTSVDSETSVNTNDHGGITYGVGATYSVAPNVLITAEAVRTDYSSEKYFQGADVDPNETKINLGIAYRFDI